MMTARRRRNLSLIAAAAAALSVGTVALAAAAGDDLTIRRNAATGVAQFVTARDGGAIPVTPGPGKAKADAADFLAEHAALFGVTDPPSELKPTKVETDNLGWTHSTYQQAHKGIEVFSGILKVHQNAGAAFVAANGEVHPISARLDVTPKIAQAQAEDIAIRERTHPDIVAPAIHESRLVIVDPGWYGDPPQGASLAYYVAVIDPNTAAAEAMFIEAGTGEVLDRWNLNHNARDRQIHDGGGGSGLPGILVRDENDVDPFGTYDVDAAYDYYGDTYDYYQRAFGRDSIDGNGLVMRATVNSTAPTCANAFWSGQILQMVFCSGTVTDDIVGHELTHGVTQFSANLIYQNQSGQLNESFSDVFGEIIDLYNGDTAFAGAPSGPAWPTHPTGPGGDTPNDLRSACSPSPANVDGRRWLMGEDAGAFGGAIRDMWDPTCRNHPDTANSTFQTCPAQDSGGVHIGSGVPNHAFAIATDGKTFNGFSVTGIGPIKSAAVWYRALTVYLTPGSDFEDAYAALNHAAADLVGTQPNDPRTGLPSEDVFTAFDAEQIDLALQAVEMNTPGRCGSNDDVLLTTAPPTCPTETLVFSDDFEAGAAGWTVFNSAPPTPYDWVLAGSLPDARPGTAFFCQDPNIGNCGSSNQSGSHSLVSPVVVLPAAADAPRLTFTHYMSSEGGWDAGTVRISVNLNPWQSVPYSACRHNPYNGRTITATQGNTNPLAGLPGFTGTGGTWGTTVMDLSGFAGAGDALQLRFDFGKDGCTGALGWYVDDLLITNCGDCDTDANADDRNLSFTAASGPLGNIGVGVPQSFTMPSPPPAAGEVRIDVTAVADMSNSTEFITIDVNGTVVGNVFVSGGSDCPVTPDRDKVFLPAAVFNAAVAGGNAVIGLTASPDVTPTPGLAQCGSQSYVMLFVSYALADCNANAQVDACETDCDGNGTPDECDIAGGAPDADKNGVPDVCESGACCRVVTCSDGAPAACADFVCNVSDHQPETFLGCFGDADGNGVVNAGDRGFVSANIGQTDNVLLCLFDVDGNGTVNAGDRGFVSANIGLCEPLPDYQNGSGLNGGAPDTRFSGGVFQGFGTNCATTTCP